ncbi:hypothetical protein GCM10009678_56810 [Actinomadura kijaniata]|uniref:Carboxymethylenebutenolidase n=1 Tax=Actinomadura namibiensis TaxID=182080 RepID=A0A7W3LL89_ACTNM|nr:dienelactone hydrolase family protein [Actinomadura namibiensis]MBA8950117.1 carboxymethylenebutenolidase [Actinomadura namibiensis]
MCHPTDARPPAPPADAVTGEAAEHGHLELTAADGNRFTAYRAVPSAPLGRNVVILTDFRGLHPFYEALARRFAELGYHALAIDPYGRTAGLLPRDGSFDGPSHLPLLEPAHVDADVAAAAARLRAENPGPLFTVGFCLGGGHSWRQAATGPGLAGAVGFYGPPRFFGDNAENLDAPLLLLLAGNDSATTPEEFDELTGRFDAAGRDYDKHVYDGAPHSFFDVASEEWKDECADAWRRVLAFLERHA